MKMTVVITMAGLGSRFRKEGYKMPKYQIEAHGRTLFDWSMESLKGFADPENDYIFVVRKEDDAEEFIRSSCEKIGITNVTVIGSDYLTDGQATTAMLAKDVWDKESALMIYNIDTYVEAYEKAAPTGRMRKYYHLTRAGRAALTEEEKAWQEYSGAVNAVLHFA